MSRVSRKGPAFLLVTKAAISPMVRRMGPPWHHQARGLSRPRRVDSLRDRMLVSRAFEALSSRIDRRHTMSDGMRSSSPAQLTRRAFMAASGATAAVAGFPAVLRAQTREVKVGYILPVTGPLAFEAALALNGLTLATDKV